MNAIPKPLSARSAQPYPLPDPDTAVPADERLLPGVSLPPVFKKLADILARAAAPSHGAQQPPR